MGGAEDAYAPWLELQHSTSGKVVWTNSNGGHWIILRGNDMHNLLADVERLSSRTLPGRRELSEAAKLIPLQMDPPEHAFYRDNITKEMGPEYISEFKEPIREITTSLIEGFRKRGSCNFIDKVY